MTHRSVMIGIVLSLGCVVAVYAQTDSIRTELRAIETLYNFGSYMGAEIQARRMLERSDIDDSTRSEIHKFIAFSLIAQGKPELAKERFLALLKILPDYSLDPVYTSPKILIIFNETKQHFLANQKKAKPGIDFPAAADRPAITYRTVLFPGWEQLHSGRTVSGTIFLGAGIATFGAGITFELLRSSAREDYLSVTDPLDFDSKYNTYDRYYKAEIASFIAFAVVYIASEIDVFTAPQDTPVAIRAEYSKYRGSTLSFAIKF